MARFTLSSLFTPWTSVTARQPAKAGWYRTRTEALTHSWWNGMAYFDGSAWWEFGSHGGLAVRREVRVLQWQGLAMPVAHAVDRIRAHWPKSRGAQRRYEQFLATLAAA